MGSNLCLESETTSLFLNVVGQQVPRLEGETVASTLIPFSFLVSAPSPASPRAGVKAPPKGCGTRKEEI
jgi:hypothetical protein